jgi:hypothetical protein
MPRLCFAMKFQMFSRKWKRSGEVSDFLEKIENFRNSARQVELFAEAMHLRSVRNNV